MSTPWHLILAIFFASTSTTLVEALAHARATDTSSERAASRADPRFCDTSSKKAAGIEKGAAHLQLVKQRRWRGECCRLRSKGRHTPLPNPQYSLAEGGRGGVGGGAHAGIATEGGRGGVVRVLSRPTAFASSHSDASEGCCLLGRKTEESQWDSHP